jgi:hypothetical protein
MGAAMAVRRGLEGTQIRVIQPAGNGHLRRVSWNRTIINLAISPINLAEDILFCRVECVRR